MAGKDAPDAPNAPNAPVGTVTLQTYDNRLMTLPASAAMHCKRLRNDFLDEHGARRGGAVGPIPLSGEGDRSCVHQTMQYAVSYLKMCDAMAGLPGSGYSIEDDGVNLVSVHLPSIYTYLGRGTARLAWEQALCAFKTAISTLGDHFLVQLMYTAEALGLRGMRDTVVMQIAIRIEKGSAAEITVLAEGGGELLISTLVLLCADYVHADEELALQFVRALAVLVQLGFGQDIRTFRQKIWTSQSPSKFVL